MGKPNVDELPLQFTSHPPERGRAGNIEPACAGASCSCCCCCLHTLGGLVGALVFSLQETSSRRPSNQEELDFHENITEGEESLQPMPEPIKCTSVSAIYWRTLLVLSLCWISLGTVITLVTKNARNVTDAVLFIGLFGLLVFPGIQLFAGLITYKVLAFDGRGGKPENEFGQLARMNLGILLGSVAGFLFMVFGYFIFK